MRGGCGGKQVTQRFSEGGEVRRQAFKSSSKAECLVISAPAAPYFTFAEQIFLKTQVAIHVNLYVTETWNNCGLGNVQVPIPSCLKHKGDFFLTN